MVVTKPTNVRGTECMEIQVEDRVFEPGLEVPNGNLTFYARTEEIGESRWISVVFHNESGDEFLHP